MLLLLTGPSRWSLVWFQFSVVVFLSQLSECEQVGFWCVCSVVRSVVCSVVRDYSDSVICPNTVSKRPDFLPALQRMNPLDFNDPTTFPLAPPSG